MEQKEHINIAARFVNFCLELDRLRPILRRKRPPHASEKDYPPTVKEEDYLITLLKHRVQSAKDEMANYATMGFETRIGVWHVVVEKRYERPAFPRPIRNGLKDINSPLHSKEHCELTWIVCYLEGIRPNQKLPNWEKFECSHRCIEYSLSEDNYCCIDPDCLCWESKSDNQSRGNNFCTKKCSHKDICDKCICECQGIHNPPCK